MNQTDAIAREPIWQQAIVQPGQSLADLFKQQGLSTTDLQRALDADNGRSGLARIRPGQYFEFLRGANDELLAMRYDRDETQRVTLQFYGNRAAETVQPLKLERRTRVAHGVINDSLFDAGGRAGMSNAMVLELAKVFGYDIDFAQDLRDGDSFSVIYDNVYRDGDYLRPGNIIAAEFINRGRRYTAFRYTQPDGNVTYYSEDGRPMRKSFLRTPVDFTRISSRFSVARMHPVLGRMRAHKGVDYAAPVGTPIYAAGDGVVQFKGWESGYGNFVLIRHNKDISTAYGHMSRFASSLRKGERVRQGQVIGYVGMTGLATGPHLHYEFRVDGTQRDPLTVTLPKPDRLPGIQLAAFRRSIAPTLVQIEQVHGRGTHLASAK
jgi:murein DD-endopeptidase MepM/ murein hydrolase activator NlpD